MSNVEQVLPVLTETQSTRRISGAAIKTFLTDCFIACGMSPTEAETVAGAMLEADLTGSDAHGVFRLAGYVRQLKRGVMNPKPKITVLERAPATALIDGDQGLGHVVMTYAANLAIELARASGIGWVGARRSNHAGAGAIYAVIPVEHGMVGHLRRIVERSTHGAVGRIGAAARHQSDRGRDSGRQGGAGGVRHRHLGGVERCDPHPPARTAADAGRLGAEPHRRLADHRSELDHRGHLRAGRRLQGQRSVAHHRSRWPARSTAPTSAATSPISPRRRRANSMSDSSWWRWM